MSAHIRICNVSKHYPEHNVQALNEVSFELEYGEFVALAGPSGCGKSTLLNLVAGLDRPSGGTIFLGDSEITDMDDEQLTTTRAQKVGFVFQFFNLISTLTAYENVALPLEITGRMDANSVKSHTTNMLSRVGLSERANFYPSQLSGGEMQRIAVARALVHSPEIIIADEPTGNLDTETGKAIVTLLKQLASSGGHTVLMATHSSEPRQFASRVIRMKDGRIIQ